MCLRISSMLCVFLLFFCEILGVFSGFRTKRDEPVSYSDQIKAVELLNQCTCVIYYLCDSDGFIITNGRRILEERLGQSSSKRIICAGGEFDGEYVCCKHKPGEENKSPVNTERPSTSTSGKLTLKEPENKTCGKQLPSISVRIFQDEGELTPVNGEFPWLAAIFRREADSPQWMFHSSGSLIHPRVILTANHVVKNSMANNLKVLANGQIKLSEIGDTPSQERNVKEIIKHSQFNSEMLYYDVALLILEEPYNISSMSQVNTLCINPNISYENKRCLVAGWGRTPTTDGTVKVLKKVELPILAHSKCEELLRIALNNYNFNFHKSLMCAGGDLNKDACKGDGGSPLMCPTGIANSMYQVGIVAWGIGCGKQDVPGVYANVGFLHEWIVSQLTERDIEI